MALIKTEIFTSCKVLYTKSCTRIKSVLVLQKMLSKIQIFLAYNVSSSKKKNWHSLFVKIFQVSANEGMGLNKVNLLSFELKNFFKFVLVWLAQEKQNILVTSQPCLHTLM